MTRFQVSLLTVVAFALSISLMTSSIAQEEGRRRGEGRGQERGQQGRRFGGGFRGFGGSIDKTTLAGAEQVQKELEISEEQRAKISDLLADYRNASRELFSGLRSRDLSREEREKRFAEMQKKREQLVKDTEKKLDAILNKKQLKRLNEIALQQRGIEGLRDHHIAASLSLSKKQIEKITRAITNGQEKRRQLFQDLRGSGRQGFEGMREKMEEIRKATDANVLAALTDEQKKKFESLKGKAFELDRRNLFPGGGPRGRGGEGRGGRGGGGERRRPPSDDDA